jgi:hypothetical protein
VPTVKRINTWLVMIYLDDHPPIHVHVFGAEWEVEVWLEPETTLKEYSKCWIRHAWKVVAAIEPHRNDLIGSWKEIHGHA